MRDRHVVIADKEVILKADSYKKRAKVFNEGKCVYSKPVYLEASMYSFKDIYKYIQWLVKPLRFILLMNLLLLCCILWLSTFDSDDDIMYNHNTDSDISIHSTGSKANELHRYKDDEKQVYKSSANSILCYLNSNKVILRLLCL